MKPPLEALRALLGLEQEQDEQVYPTGREARRRAARKAGVLKGSRAHIGRMADRKKAWPSLATAIALYDPETGRLVRVQFTKEEAVRAHAVKNAREGEQR